MALSKYHMIAISEVVDAWTLVFFCYMRKLKANSRKKIHWKEKFEEATQCLFSPIVTLEKFGYAGQSSYFYGRIQLYRQGSKVDKFF